MEILKTLIWVVQMVSALTVIVLVLLQHGKGADAGATFGSGNASGSLFGASGSSNFLSRTTAIFAGVFFVSTFVLVMLTGSAKIGNTGVMSNYINSNKNQASASITSATHSNSSGVKSRSASGVQKNQIPE